MERVDARIRRARQASKTIRRPPARVRAALEALPARPALRRGQGLWRAAARAATDLAGLIDSM